jgi:pyruvate,orthophosphate dikinase
MTSHAAVVARGMGKPCVCGAGSLKIDLKGSTATVAGKTFRPGDVITIDGASGEVFEGRVPTLKAELTGDFATLMGWADAVRRMQVRANAETPNDARTAREFGAEGIGLCRTEHMFFEGERIVAVREMILASDPDGRRAALEKLLPMQRQDFSELFAIMRGLPVTIRLLDPPLHEFLPKTDEEIDEVAAAMKVDAALLRERVLALTESNPMLGHRGCRLLITYPEVAEMQTRAILEAAADAAKKTGEAVTPEIMVPLVGMRSEFDHVRATIDATAKKLAANGSPVAYTVGTMIELPRAALRAQEIAEVADFFSFGTNDLTQTTFGISRDDAGGFIAVYEEKGLIEKDPFQTLDTEGVGVLVRVAASEGRKAKPALKLGICGEHGGDPASIRFCDTVGLDYVSCSPFRVPIARLAAAQAALASALGGTTD